MSSGLSQSLAAFEWIGPFPSDVFEFATAAILIRPVQDAAFFSLAVLRVQAYRKHPEQTAMTAQAKTQLLFASQVPTFHSSYHYLTRPVT